MPKNNFSQRKKSILSKSDKSSRGKWDTKIVKLCKKINKKEEYYTTSSCSGRIIVMIDQDKKESNLFKFVSHDLIGFDDFWKYFPKKLVKLNLKFKQEPCIIHVACRTLEDAQRLLDNAKSAGWKKSGIISLGNRIIVELSGTEKLEFPLSKDGEILVRNEFLEVVIEKANENLKKSWEKIEKLGKLI